MTKVDPKPFRMQVTLSFKDLPPSNLEYQALEWTTDNGFLLIWTLEGLVVALNKKNVHSFAFDGNSYSHS